MHSFELDSWAASAAGARDRHLLARSYPHSILLFCGKVRETFGDSGPAGSYLRTPCRRRSPFQGSPLIRCRTARGCVSVRSSHRAVGTDVHDLLAGILQGARKTSGRLRSSRIVKYTCSESSLWNEPMCNVPAEVASLWRGGQARPVHPDAQLLRNSVRRGPESRRTHENSASVIIPSSSFTLTAAAASFSTKTLCRLSLACPPPP